MFTQRPASALAVLALLLASPPLFAQTVRQPVLLDTDIGNDVDDGPLTNLARFVEEKQEGLGQLRRVVLRAGDVAADVKAARAVFGSGVSLVVIPDEITAKLKLGAAERKRLFAPATALSLQTQ